MNVSFLKTAKNAVTSRAARQILTAQKHSPAMLFGVGVVGVVTTTVLACRATLKLEEVLDESKGFLENAEYARKDNDRYSDKDYYHDVALIRLRAATSIVKLYGPSLIVGVTSVCALGGSHVILTKRNAGLAAAYAAVEKAFGQYRERVTTEVGEDKERELYRGVKTEEVHDTKAGKVEKKQSIVSDDTPYAKLFDQYNVNWSPQPEYNVLFLRCQQNWANDQLQARGHLFLNEVYDSLGLERTKAGQVVGWVKGNGDDYVDFGILNGEDPEGFYSFVTGHEGIWLDFNVDGVVYDKI